MILLPPHTTPTKRLHTLNINAIGIGRGDPGRPPISLFNTAINVQEFRLPSKRSPPLDHFAFPNLTFFELSAAPVEEFQALQLLDFLEASPMLQSACMKIAGDILLAASFPRSSPSV